MNKLEIEYEVDSLAGRTLLVRSPNLDISIGLTVSIILGPNVLSIQNHKMAGSIKLDGGAVTVNDEMIGPELGDSAFLYPIRFFKNVTSAKLG